MTEQVDMSQFIAARSDQMNADDLMDNPRTITITKVTATPDSAEQPVSIHYEGDQGKSFKPCKTVRRIMVGVWGKDASQYVGRSMTLYRDPAVAFGGMQVGGIRVSHMSHIDGEKTVALMVTRGRKAPFKVLPLKLKVQPADDQAVALKAITDAAEEGMEALSGVWKQKWMAPHREALQIDLDRLKIVAEVKDKPAQAPTATVETVNVDAGEITPSELQKIADALMKSFDDAGATIDLIGLKSQAEMDIAAMPDEMAEAVEASYSANSKRLKEQFDKAQAREKAGAGE